MNRERPSAKGNMNCSKWQTAEIHRPPRRALAAMPGGSTDTPTSRSFCGRGVSRLRPLFGKKAVALLVRARRNRPCSRSRACRSCVPRTYWGTRPPNRRDHEIARLDTLDEMADLDKFGERLVTEHQAIASRRGSAVLEGGDLPIGATNPDFGNLKPRLGGSEHARIALIHQLHLSALQRPRETSLKSPFARRLEHPVHRVARRLAPQDPNRFLGRDLADEGDRFLGVIGGMRRDQDVIQSKERVVRFPVPSLGRLFLEII